jgi:hypothetical protein
VHFTGPGGSPAVVEYATLTTSPATTYVHAVERIESGASCSDVAGGQATSSVFDEVIPVPGYGVRSVGMLVSSTDDGVTSQTGYDLVRQAGDVVVVGYTTTGTLDAAALGRVTAEALSTFAH